MLYMEGLPHISVTDMGRNLVLLFSPKTWEIENFCKAKADWLCYYFKDVKPWSPSSYADRRDMWVKVYGIPLHAWWESLFKVIGSKYEEFLDFDNPTASRSKLVVARIKIATRTKDFALVLYYDSRIDDHDGSWVESSNFTAEAVDRSGEDDGVSVEEGEENDRVDLHTGHYQRHGEKGYSDGDVSVDKEDLSQYQLCVSVNDLVVLKDNRVHFDASHVGFVGTKEDYCCYPGEKSAKGNSGEGPKKGEGRRFQSPGREAGRGGAASILCKANQTETQDSLSLPRVLGPVPVRR
ncbi:hypothetical protein A2U01_0016071, partial [Trifolium medium]|nr:hypothetical protein [Trifolium medium]